MMERHFDARFINEVANHPSVYPWVSGPINGPFDATSIIENRNNIALMGRHGGFVFLAMGNGVYDAHSLVLPRGRGEWALEAARYALNWMFERGADEILMLVPKGNLAVRALVKCLGGVFRERVERGWWIGGRLVPADLFSLTIEDWESCR